MTAARLEHFCFPEAPPPPAPSLKAMAIDRLARRIAALSGALAVCLLALVLFAHLAAARADVTPYVADGGIRSCPVTRMETAP